MYTNRKSYFLKSIVKKLAEFNLKLLNGTILSGNILCKWYTKISTFCSYCGYEESTEHLLFSCRRIQQVWSLLSEALLFRIEWKHIVLGSAWNCDTTRFRNFILSVVARSIFVERIKCYDLTNDNFNQVNLKTVFKLSLFMHCKICELSFPNRQWLNKVDMVLRTISDI